MLIALLAAALALRLYGIDWDQGHGFHPDERSFYMRAGDMLCALTAGPDTDGPYCSAAHLRSFLAAEHWKGMEPGLPDLRTALSAERSPLNPRWFPLGSALIYALVLLRILLEPFVDWGVMELRFVGRTLVALADMASVALIYAIGRRMYGKWTGVLAAALTAFAAIHIQHAHYYRPEPFTVLASLAALWAMLRFIDTGRARDAALLGVLVGFAMAPKVSVAPVLAPLALTFLWVAKDRSGRDWARLRPGDVARVAPIAALSGAAALAAFFITTPYAFLDFANFIGDIREQAGMAGEAGHFPFTWQYAETPPFLYQMRQTVIWGLGLPLGIVAWVAAPATAWFAWRGGITQRSDLLLLAWAVPAFVFLELFEVKFLRYVFPLMPFYVLMAARMLVSFTVWARRRRSPLATLDASLPDDAPFSEEWHATPPTVGDDMIFDEPLFGDEPFGDAPFSEEWHATPPLSGAPVSAAPLVPATPGPSDPPRRPGLAGFIDRWALPASVLTLAIVLTLTVLYAVAVAGIYGRPHTAIAASEWINDNVPKRASIINGGSYWDEQVPDLRGYDVWTFPAYHPDRDPRKIPELIERLAGSDYVIFYSNRAYGSVSRLPGGFPSSSSFYRLLFAGHLGYELERAFTSYPSLLGVHLRDDPYRRAGLPAPPVSSGGNDGQPGGITINLGYADENVVGYDHPQVLLFRNVHRLSESEIRGRIAEEAESVASTATPLMLSPSALEAQRAGGTWSDLFDRDGWANRVPWLSWLLAIELICLVAFPFTWWLMRPLPDRGVFFARVVGLLMVACVAWWLVSAGVLRYSTGAIWLAMLIVAVPSVAVLSLQWREMLGWLREKWRLVVTAEALFLAAYLAFVLIRAANPDLWHPWRGGEKPMELAYFTAVVRSSVFPPYDPWFSGGYLNYYYWGYFILSVPVRLIGLPPTTAFNVAVPLLFALTATGVGSLVYNLAASVVSPRPSPRAKATAWASPRLTYAAGPLFRRAATAGSPSQPDATTGTLPTAAAPPSPSTAATAHPEPVAGQDSNPRPASSRRPGARLSLLQPRARLVRVISSRSLPGTAAVAGLAAAIMATVSGNLDGVVQLAEMAQRKLDGMPVPLSSFDFWRSSRAIPETPEFDLSPLTPWIESDNFVETGFHITEFPFFTFLFADLHAHMMTMPFAVLALALGWSLLVGLRDSSLWAWRPWVTIVALGVVVGGLWAINSWEYPAYALLMVVCTVGAAWLMPGEPKTRLAVAAALSLLALAVSYAAFLPFHSATETFGTGIEPTRWQTPMVNYLLIHALPLLGAACLLAAVLPRAASGIVAQVRRRQPLTAHDQWLLLGVALGVFLACYFWAAGFAAVGFLLVAFTLTVWAMGGCLASRDYTARLADLMALAMLALALAIGIGVDLIRIEGDIARMNTLFKYYLVAWLLFAASGAYGFWRGWTSMIPVSGRIRRPLVWAGVGIVALVAVGTLVYPALATPVRVQDRFNPLPWTLDGAAWMRDAVYHPPAWCSERPLDPIEIAWDYDAIRWLQDNVAGTPVVLEGHGVQYCWNSRISQYTGLPTVLGWPWHQQQQRNDGDVIKRRARDVRTIYSTLSHLRALELLEQYRVAYIVVGALERGYYDARGLDKFDDMVGEGLLTLAYANNETRIYRVSD